MLINLSRCWLILLVVAILEPGKGFAKKKEPEPPAPVTATTLTPALNKRIIMDGLALFGKLLRVEYTASGEREIIVEIAPILNKSGVDKEVPNELSQWVREAIADIGYPLRSYEAVPSPLLVRPVFPGSGPADRPQHAALTYRVTGVLERFFEREIRGRELEFYLRAGGGSNSIDGQGKRTKRATVTRVTLSLTLEQPDGLDLATATYFVDIVKTEFDRSWGLFVGGTGLGGNRTVMTAGDPGDAIFDATSAALMTIIGRSSLTLAPYYRCSSIFPEDETVNELERRTLNRMIPTEILTQKIKPYVYLSNVAKMDMKTPAVTPADQEQIEAQMRLQHLDPDDPNSYARYAYKLWHDVPIEVAAERLETRIVEVIHFLKQKQAAEETEAAQTRAREEAWNISPSKFAWPATARIALLDLTKVSNDSLRAKIVAALRTCTGCQEVKTDATGSVAAVRLRPSSQTATSEQQTIKMQAALEEALCRCRLNVDYLWVGERFKRLSVTPSQSQTGISFKADPPRRQAQRRATTACSRQVKHALRARQPGAKSLTGAGAG